MKKIALILLVALLGTISPIHGQFFKKLKKRAEEAAKETVHRKVENKTAEKTEKAMDSILNLPDKKKGKRKGKKSKDFPSDSEDDNYDNEEEYYEDEEGIDTEELAIYSKFDFVPGDELLFFDDFSNDFSGDFPAKWNTNGTGEVVTIGEDRKKWFEFKAGHGLFYIPDFPDLPEEFTIEFDMLTDGLNQQTTSSAILKILLSDDTSFKEGNYAAAHIPFCQYSAIGIRVRDRAGNINSVVEADIRDVVLQQAHVSIAVNKQRFRLWINESKYLDVPRLISATKPPTTLKLGLLYFEDGKERFFIKNLKLAKGGQDLRRTLLAEGRISTNAILFDSGSANLQPQSMGVIRQISQVLEQENDLNLLIIGHTDADGDEETNLELSHYRAEAVKNALINVYGIDGSRLGTEGKGETEPVSDNDSADGKAANRRVEFIKQ